MPFGDSSQFNISLLPTTNSPDCATNRFMAHETNGDNTHSVVTQTSSAYAAIGFHEPRNRCQPPFSVSNEVKFSINDNSLKKGRI
jgi:hypothetical protein